MPVEEGENNDIAASADSAGKFSADEPGEVKHVKYLTKTGHLKGTPAMQAGS